LTCSGNVDMLLNLKIAEYKIFNGQPVILCVLWTQNQSVMHMEVTEPSGFMIES